jgi:heavy metal sensor kinase
VSLRLRLTLWYGLLLAVALLAAGCLLYVVLRANLERQLDRDLALRADQIARGLRLEAGGRLQAEDLRPGLLGPRSVFDTTGPDLYAQVLDLHAEPIDGSPHQLPLDPEPILAALAGQESWASLPLAGGRTARVLTRPLTVEGQVVGVVQVGNSFDSVQSTLREVRDILLLGLVVVLVVAVLGGFLLGGRALSPIRRVSATARRIAETGDYGQRLPPRRNPDEVGELVGTFNALIERVQASLEQQQRFLADTSHELRTPLTVIRANLSFLWRETDPETRADCLREAETEAARMSRLVTDLLLLGQSESAAFLQRAPLDLAAVLQDVAEQARARGDGRPVELSPLEPVVIRADADRIRQMLWNLVENALRYTPAEAPIRLSLRRTAGFAEVSVADEGPGIPAEHLPRIFERFYRVDSARSRASGGSGLGLAIVRHIAEAHGGEVSAQSEPGRGSTFRVRLPLAEPLGARAAAQPLEHQPPIRLANGAAR